MFVGHFAAGFAGKSAAPRTSLGTLFLSAQLVDLVWPTLLLLGVERVRIAPGITRVTPLDFVHYPWTHGLLAGVGWALLLAGGYLAVRRYPRGALVVGLLVMSHWLLDAVTHRPDLPVLPGGDARVGLGLWSSLAGTLAVELLLFAAGVALYARATRARDRVGSWALWSLVAFLLLVYGANLFGPPPASVEQIAVAGHAQWLLVAWAYWVDRHRGLSATSERPRHG